MTLVSASCRQASLLVCTSPGFQRLQLGWLISRLSMLAMACLLRGTGSYGPAHQAHAASAHLGQA